MKSPTNLLLASMLFVLALSGCAVTGKLQQEELALSYKKQMITENHFLISVTSKQGASWEKIKTFLVDRAAELTVTSGFTEFELLNTQQAEEIQLEEVPALAGSAIFRDEAGGNVDVRPSYTTERRVRFMSAEVKMAR